jgi:16S rRNA processing protein RimM
MDYVLVGRYVKTHGIKGEIKIKSSFKYKEKVFKIGNKVYLNNQEFTIKSYRVHQEYDMVTFDGISDINQILPFKGSNVYILKDDLNLNKNEYLDTDLINLDVYQNDKLIGKVSDIMYITDTKKLLVIDSRYIPFELVKEINFQENKITVEEVVGLL